MLTDTHCHLDLEQFDADRTEVLRRAEQAGLTRILVPGISFASSLSVVKLAESHPVLFAAVGIHPTEASGIDRSALNDLRKLAHHPKVKAIGEIGLDYYWNSAPHELQVKVLRFQLDLAAGLGLPVILHMREDKDALNEDCARDLLQILENWVAGLRLGQNPLANRPGVLHSFSGSLETARRALSLGFTIGVTGPVTYPNARTRQDIVAALPLEHLLLETDAPFQAPHPYRGKRNESSYVRLIADKIALLHACTLEEVATATSENAGRLFSWKEIV